MQRGETMTSQKDPSAVSTARLRSDAVFETLRALADRGGNLLGALGIFLVAGVVIAGIATWIFSELAERVMGGGTQAFDDMVLRWIATKHTPVMDGAMLELSLIHI